MSFNPVIREEFIPNNLNISIYTRTWEPVNATPKVHIVFIHGHGEHVTRYDHVFNEFAKNGLKVHAFDQVGCGKTGQRVNDLGGVMGIKRVLLDVNDAIDRVYDPDIPLFLMGHSFGGASTLTYLAIGDRRDLIKGAFASAPCIKIAKEFAPIMPLQMLVNNMAPLFPSVKVPVYIDAKRISRDKTEVKKYAEDSLIFSRCALIQVRDLLYQGQELLNGHYKKITIPQLYLCHGSSDTLASFEATKELANKIKAFNKVSNLQFKEYPGAYHELHNDIIKKEVIASHLKWFLDQLK